MPRRGARAILRFSIDKLLRASPQFYEWHRAKNTEMKYFIVSLWGAVVLSFLTLWFGAMQVKEFLSGATETTLMLWLPPLMLALSFAVFTGSKKIFRFSHNIIVGLALVGYCIGIISLRLDASSTSAVGAYFFAFAIGAGYILFLAGAAVAHGVMFLFRRNA